MTLTASFTSARAAGVRAHRALGCLAGTLTDLCREAVREADEVARLVPQVGEADSDTPEDDSALGLVYARLQRDTTFARGDLRGQQEALLRLADDAGQEAARVCELALALPLAGAAGGAQPGRSFLRGKVLAVDLGTVELHNGEVVGLGLGHSATSALAEAAKAPRPSSGTVELMNGEPVGHPACPCADADCPRCGISPQDAAEIAAALPTLAEIAAAEGPAVRGEDVHEALHEEADQLQKVATEQGKWSAVISGDPAPGDEAAARTHADDALLASGLPLEETLSKTLDAADAVAALPPAVDAPPAPSPPAERRSPPAKGPRARPLAGRGRGRSSHTGEHDAAEASHDALPLCPPLPRLRGDDHRQGAHLHPMPQARV